MCLQRNSVTCKKKKNYIYINCSIIETKSRELYCIQLYFKLILRSGPRLKTVNSVRKWRKGISIHSQERPWGGEARGCHSPVSAERSTSPGHRDTPGGSGAAPSTTCSRWGCPRGSGVSVAFSSRMPLPRWAGRLPAA